MTLPQIAIGGIVFAVAWILLCAFMVFVVYRDKDRT